MVSLQNLLNAALAFAPLTVLAAPTESSKRQSATLDSAIKGAGKQYFGTCTDPGLWSNGAHSEVLAREFGSVTCENSMKWGSLEANRGSYNWDPADQVVARAGENGQEIRGHTLIWHSQLPSWVDSVRDPGELTSVIEDHIATVMGRWAGQITHWDVINEMLNEDGSLRQSVFSDVLGEDFVGIAFNAARAADPNAKLYINDYNLDNAGYAKTQGMVDLVNRNVANGVPIDGIGSQGHLGAGAGGSYQGALELLASANVDEIAVTELDIGGASAGDYSAAVGACINVSKCVGVTVWGISDATSWRPDSYPLLFDGNYQPKDAYGAVIDVMS